LESGGREGIRALGLLVANEEKSEIRHDAAITQPFEEAFQLDYLGLDYRAIRLFLCLYQCHLANKGLEITEAKVVEGVVTDVLGLAIVEI